MRFIEGNIDREQWRALVRRSGDATAFQTVEGYELYKRCAEYEAFAFGMEDEGRLRGMVCGAVHRNGPWGVRWFTRRAIVFGGPVVDEEVSVEEMRWFLERVVERLRGRAIYLEFRFYSIYERYREAFDRAGVKWEMNYDSVIATEGFEAMMGKIQKRKRRQINSAVRMGVTVNENPTEEDVRRYYPKFRKLHWLSSHKPVPTVEFFVELWKSSVGKIIMIEYEGRTIGFSAFLILEGRTVYYLYECGDDEVFEGIDASSVTYWSVLKWCTENGIKVCDTMGAGVPWKPYGVREFKRRMGGELVNYGRARYLYYPTLYRIAARITGADENLPGYDKGNNNIDF